MILTDGERKAMNLVKSLFLIFTTIAIVSTNALAQVIDGQLVNAATTNNAFLKRTVGDADLGTLSLINTDPASGSSITNIQTEINSCSSFSGKPLNSTYNALPSWTNNDVGLSSDTLKDRADSLTAKFNLSTGHKHTGAAGDGPQLTDASIAPNASLSLSKLATLPSNLAVITGPSGNFNTSTATSTEVGYLSGVTSSIQTQINGKEPTISGTTSADYFRGDKTFANFATAVRGDVSATSPLAYSSATGIFSIPQATGATGGYLSASDWSLFNSKQSALGYTPLNKAGDTATNLELSNELTFDQIATPSSPISGKNKIYFKNDNKLYELNSSGVETAVGTGAGGGGGTAINILASYDYNFELNAPATNWTASGGTLTSTATAANVGDGSYAGSWVSSAGSQTLDSALVAIPAGLYGQNGELKVMLETAATDFTLEVFDGTNILAQQTVTGNGASSYGTYSLNFVFPTSGSIRMRLVSGSAKTIYIDDAYLGTATNIGTSNQITALGNQYPVTLSASFGTTTNNVFLSRRDGQFLEVTGSFTGGSPAASQAYIQMPSGLSIDTTTLGSIQKYLGYWTVGQGTSTNVYNASSAVLFYDGSTTDKVFIANTVTSTGYVAANANSIENNTVPQFFKFRVPIKGWTASTIVTPDTQAMSWSGYITNTSRWLTSSSTFADLTSAGTITLVQRQSNNFPAVSLASGTRPGVTFTPKKPGTYYLCMNPKAYVGTSGDQIGLRIYDGSTEIARTGGGGLSYPSFVPLCGVYNISSLSPVTLVIQGATPGSNDGIDLTGSYNNSVEIYILDVSQSLPLPNILNQVTTKNSSGERIERALIANNGTTASFTKQSDSAWTVSRTSAGKVTISFNADAFSDTPSCTATVQNSGTTAIGYATGIENASNTSIEVNTETYAGADSDVPVSVICMGPK